jgi:hypothetical protein
MRYALLADAVVAIHFAFAAFVVFGGFLAWRWRSVVYAHLPALAWGCWVELSHRICPLTPLENHLRERGGEAGYSGSFLAHYLHGLLYPPGLTADTQWVLAGFLLVVNAVAYGGLWVRHRGRARS